MERAREGYHGRVSVLSRWQMKAVADALRVEVDREKDGNLVVRELYKNQGYAKTGDFKNHYYHFDFIIYEKLL